LRSSGNAEQVADHCMQASPHLDLRPNQAARVPAVVDKRWLCKFWTTLHMALRSDRLYARHEQQPSHLLQGPTDAAGL
jgi:hypothetical protein